MARKRITPEMLEGAAKYKQEVLSEPIQFIPREMVKKNHKYSHDRTIHPASRTFSDNDRILTPRVRAALQFPPSEIIELRVQCGNTQKEQAAILKVSHTSYLAWEKGDSLPTPRSLRRLVALRDIIEYVPIPTPLMMQETRLAYAQSVADIAIHFGVSAQTVNRWEAGISTPSAKNLRKLAELCRDAKEMGYLA